jgi:hypothetical protein
MWSYIFISHKTTANREGLSSAPGRIEVLLSQEGGPGMLAVLLQEKS